MADDVVDAGGLDQLLLAQQEQQVLANWSTDDHSKSDVLQLPALRTCPSSHVSKTIYARPHTSTPTPDGETVIGALPQFNLPSKTVLT